MLVSVASTDMFDNNTFAVDCSDGELRIIEASLYQVLHRKNISKRTADNSTTNARTEGIGSITRDCKEVRSEEHV